MIENFSAYGQALSFLLLGEAGWIFEAINNVARTLVTY